MRLSKACWQTYKEIPKEAEIPSHQLLMKAGMLHKSGAGIYQYLPFAQRVIHKIKKIIREELDNIYSQEITMSMVTPGDLWKESGRWDLMENLMIQFSDRAGKDLCLSPTNEESVTDIFRKIVKSYKQLPVSLYQINTKFRDEIRPRFGLMRGREFVMKDAYTFHLDKECLDKGYDEMYQAYSNIFKRMGLDFAIVEADAGNMGSSNSKTHEFQVIAETGEDDIVYTEDGSYSANIERAETIREGLDFLEMSDLEEVETPKMRKIADVCEKLEVKEYQSLKSLVYTSIVDNKEEHYLILLLGDDELNEVKLKNYLGSTYLSMTKDEIIKDLGLTKGFIGPMNCSEKIKVLYDKSINMDASYIVGANKLDYHFKGFVPSRDCTNKKTQVDLRLAKVNDLTLDKKSKIKIKKGIEVGHIFQLGEKYTKSMKAQVLDQNGKKVNPLMGCYGIGVTRTMAAAIEQNHDEQGMIWPMAIAPFQVYFAVIGKSDETKSLGSEIYEELKTSGVEVLFDDRGQGPGAMFKDADLLGVPVRLTLGERDYKEDGMLEIKLRKNGEVKKIKRDELVQNILNTIKELS